MEINQEIIERRINLKAKRKFAGSDLSRRGLIPSDSDKTDEMIRMTDLCLDELHFIYWSPVGFISRVPELVEID